MKSSGSPFPLLTHRPASAGLLNTSPGVCLEVKVDLGHTIQFSLSTLPCDLVQKYTLLQVLIDSDCSDLHGKTKSNRLSTLQICT